MKRGENFFGKMFENAQIRQMNEPKRFEKIPSDALLLHFSSKVQNLTVFSIICMIRIRFFGIFFGRTVLSIAKTSHFGNLHLHHKSLKHWKRSKKPKGTETFEQVRRQTEMSCEAKETRRSRDGPLSGSMNKLALAGSPMLVSVKNSRCVKFTKAVARDTKIRDQNSSLGKICPGEPQQRDPNAPKFEDRSQEKTEWQEQGAREAAWRLAKSILKEKEKIRQHSSHFRKIGACLHQIFNLVNEKFVVDSGASMHMISKKDLNSAEMGTLTKSCSPTIVITANGEADA